ncbi:MAG: Ig-like domain-containing protein, partial [Flavobacterium sp.]|nr:Ig-like domain-containing protein [Flavobacterium sp.]
MLLSFVSKGQTTLFQFDFEGSVNPNINNTAGVATINHFGVPNNFLVNDNTCNSGNSSSLSGDNWDRDDYFMFTVNTTGYGNLIFSFCNRSSNANINNFRVYSSSDQGATLNPISPIFIPGTNGAILTTNTLPASANNNTDVRIYIYKTNDPNGNNRNLYIDNVTLIGCPTTAGSLSGNQSLCVGGANGTSTFSSTVSGGTWSSSNDGVATVNSTTGLVTGVGGGTATITYTISGSGCTTRTATRTVTVSPPLTNNNVSYNNGTSGQVNATANEGNNVVLNAPVNTYFATVNFASYGTPTGTAPNFALGACHSTTSQSVTEGYLLGNTTATIPATNAVFTDPCNGTVKRLY